MNIVNTDIKLITPYDKNPRINGVAVDKVAASILEFGFQQPIVVDKDGVIIVGHTRFKAALKLNLKEIPVVYAVELTEEQVKAYRLADNKTAEFAEWDMELLAIELESLKEFDFDMVPFGFEEPEEVFEDDFDIDKVLEEIETPISKPGDVWNLGNHRLMCGDSTIITDVEKLMDGTKADMFLTDPPYNVDYKGGGVAALTIKNDSMKSGIFRLFLTDAFTNGYLSLNPTASAYVFHADSEGYNFRGAFCDAGFKLAQTCIWVKNSMVMGRQDYQWQHEPILCGEKEEDVEDEWQPVIYGWNAKARHYWHSNRKQKTVWYFDRPNKSKEHPTMKPVKLTAYPIQNSTVAGDSVLDLFGGSGSTLIACEEIGRRCFMMELDEKYCDVIIRRWEELTGEKAELKK